jgi:hypothetical protein
MIHGDVTWRDVALVKFNIIGCAVLISDYGIK